MPDPLIAIVGPTSSGKSDLAVQVALSIQNHTPLSSAVISADSRQVYKGLDIGSGKIKKEEMKQIPHYMLDVASPKHTYTVSQFQKRASAIIKKLHTSSTVPLVCGGSGLYVDALIYGYQFPSVQPNTKIRKSLSALSTQELFKCIQQKDPKKAKKIDSHNRRRLIRALEVLEEHTYIPPLNKTNPYNLHIYGIELPKKTLHKRIKERLLKRISEGMIEEVESLHTRGISHERLQSLGLEYKYCSYVLQGILSKEEMIPLLETKIRQFSKRQMTWFKKNKDIHWIDSPSLNKIEEDVLSFVKKSTLL